MLIKGKSMIIGVCGFIGSGKGTVGDRLVEKHGFKSMSFAKSLKDAVSVMFCWPRDLLEGDTKESREWRETPDKWWSKKMGQTVTPRWVLQYVGTDVMRNHFADDIWIWNLEKQIHDFGSNNIVITDMRFPNELRMLRSQDDGVSIWVRKQQLPEWYDMAHAANSDTFLHAPEAYDEMIKLGIHPSEWAWIGQPMDHTLFNDGTIDDLQGKVDSLILRLNQKVSK